MERGNMVVVLPNQGWMVTDLSVVHPADINFAQLAAYQAHVVALVRDTQMQQVW
jgi:hypothetical protein